MAEEVSAVVEVPCVAAVAVSRVAVAVSRVAVAASKAVAVAANSLLANEPALRRSDVAS